jgi:hypothetical protein
MRELIDATRESAKAAQENIEYARVVPDILTQILAKLDKLENKLDKIEKHPQARPGRRGGAEARALTASRNRARRLRSSS